MSSCGPGGAVSPGDPVPMLTLTSRMPRSKSLDAEPRDRHSRQLISPWRASWHITRSVRSGSSHPTPAPSSWNPRDCSRSRREPSRPHDRDSPTAAEPQGADPRSPRRQSGSLTSSGNAHMRMICTGEPAQRPITTRANIRQARFGIHVGRIVAYVWSRPCVQRYTRPTTRPPHLGSRPRPGPGLSFGLIHPRPPPFTDVHSDRVRAVGGRRRTPVNAMQQCWKACWGQPLRSSNLLSSATLTCKNIGEWPLPSGLIVSSGLI